MKDLFVIAPDETNQRKLEALPDASEYRFHELLSHEQVKRGRAFEVERLLHEAQSRIEAFEGPVAGILGYWDFPVSLMVPILCRKFGLPSAPVDATFKCEHKYWARVEQSKVADEHPPFDEFDPFEEDPLGGIRVDFPFWIKPVKAYLSQLGFRIGNRRDFDRALPKIRRGIDRFAKPFDYLLQFVDLPEKLAGVTGRHCIVEGMIGGRQCTVEGFLYERQVHIYGIVDGIRYPQRSSFQRLQYPSQLPDRVQQRMRDITARVMSHIGLEGGSFNIEFFWEKGRDNLWILEINPRISQSHGDQFHKVDGAPNHRVLLDLALGRKPAMPHREGAYNIAAKFELRNFDYEDGMVRRVPHDEDLARVEQRWPDAIVNIKVHEGDHLGELPDQDSYSFRLAEIYIGARNQKELLQRYGEIVDELPFEIEGIREGRAAPSAG